MHRQRHRQRQKDKDKDKDRVGLDKTELEITKKNQTDIKKIKATQD